MKIITAIQILIKLFTIGYGAGAVRTTGRFAAPAAAGKRVDTCGFYPLIFTLSLTWECRLRSERNCADAARAHKRTDTCGFRPLMNLPFPLDSLAQIADM